MAVYQCIWGMIHTKEGCISTYTWDSKIRIALMLPWYKLAEDESLDRLGVFWVGIPFYTNLFVIRIWWVCTTRFSQFLTQIPPWSSGLRRKLHKITKNWNFEVLQMAKNPHCELVAFIMTLFGESCFLHLNWRVSTIVFAKSKDGNLSSLT